MKSFAHIIRRTVYSATNLLDVVVSGKEASIVVFCYHGISSSGWKYDVDPNIFENEIEFLLTKRKPIALSDLYDFLNGKKNITEPSFIITFDDGYKNILTLKDFLNIKKIKPGLFILSDEVRANRVELGTSSDLLTKKDIKELIGDGWEIGSHSATHADFAKLTTDEIKEEVYSSKIKIEKKLGTKAEYIAYPKGKYSTNIISAVKSAGYRLGFTMDDDLITKETNPFLIPRIGVDRSHGIKEFRTLFSPSTIKLRKFLKKYNVNKYYA